MTFQLCPYLYFRLWHATANPAIDVARPATAKPQADTPGRPDLNRDLPLRTGAGIANPGPTAEHSTAQSNQATPLSGPRLPGNQGPAWERQCKLRRIKEHGRASRCLRFRGGMECSTCRACCQGLVEAHVLGYIVGARERLPGLAAQAMSLYLTVETSKMVP